jgi:hypothetical protein
MKKQPTLHEKAFKALKEAVRGVILEHKRAGRPLAVWRNEKVVWITADEALREMREKH